MGWNLDRNFSSIDAATGKDDMVRTRIEDVGKCEYRNEDRARIGSTVIPLKNCDLSTTTNDQTIKNCPVYIPVIDNEPFFVCVSRICLI